MRIAFYFVLFITLAACRKEKASWTSNWVAPIVNDTLSLKNYVNDSTLNSTASSYYQVDLTRTVLDLGISDIIQIPDTVIVQTYSISVLSFTVPPGFSVANEIKEHSLDIEPLQLKKIRLKKGKIKFRIYNPIATKTLFTVQLPGVTLNGVEFSQNYSVPAGTNENPGITDAIIDLKDYEFDLTGSTSGGFNLLQSRLVVTTDPMGPSITIYNSNQFKVEANFQGVVIDYARGYFGNLTISETSNAQLEFLNQYVSGSLDIPTPSIEVIIENGIKADASATINSLSNTNSSGSTVGLTSTQIGTPITLSSASGSWNTLVPSVKTIAFNGGNSNVESFLENLGSQQQFSYNLKMNPWGNTSGGWNEMFPNSRLKVKVKAQMPLQLGADALTLKDTFDFKFKQDLEGSYAESGEFVLKATNAFPFNCSVKMYCLNANGQVMHVIESSSMVSSSLYGSVDSDGIQKKKSEVHFIVNEAVAKDLNITEKVIIEAKFDTPDPLTNSNQQVSIPVNAFLAVKLNANLKYKAKI